MKIRKSYLKKLKQKYQCYINAKESDLIATESHLKNWSPEYGDKERLTIHLYTCKDVLNILYMMLQDLEALEGKR